MRGKQSRFIYLANSSDLDIIEFLNRRFDELAPLFRPGLISSPFIEKRQVYRLDIKSYSMLRMPDWSKHNFDERDPALIEEIRNKK